ncbi:14195_t:CDS:2 [Gigaspora margarita]|uniref:14195_t:CDS:1 n=1 Tax=Gigaspora margarita TaxID=4874 RepID=A0ABN7VRA5_GIGMA|nr:14195_t:CDS:2 [Gigaspora margarita]
MNAAQLKELIESMTKSFEDAAKDIVKGNRSGPKETNQVKVRSFSENVDNNTIEWFDDFERAAEANNWLEERKLKIAVRYLKEIAAEWYKDNKVNIIGWKDEDNQDRSFYYLLVTYIANPKKQYKWQIQLNNLTQLENEKMDAYVTNGLKGKTETFVTVTSLGNLNKAIVVARKVEAGEYYGTHTQEAPVVPDKKDEIIEALVKQVQQLSVNYAVANNQ